MDENSIITGQIPVTGTGVHKTYEESIIRMFPGDKLNAYNNEYYVDESGALEWASDKEEYNANKGNEKLKRVELLNIFRSDGYTIVEYIDPKALRQHLIAEAVMRNQYNHANEMETPLYSAQAMRKTCPNSFFRIIDANLYQKILEKSNFGIFMRKSDGLIIVPVTDWDVINDDGTFTFHKETLTNICSNVDDYEKLVILNSTYIEKNNTYFVEMIRLDAYRKNVSYERTLK